MRQIIAGQAAFVGRVPALVSRHVEEAAFLWDLRCATANSPALVLADLAAIDERLEAHVDGLRVAGAEARRQSDLALGQLGSSEAFVSTLLAIEDDLENVLERNLSIAQANPKMRAGTLSALGWSSPAQLRGLVRSLLRDPDRSFHRLAGIVACCQHGVEPGRELDAALTAEDSALRAAAFRACGELGRADRFQACQAALRDEEPSVRFWAAWSAVLLGDRGAALNLLICCSREPGPWRDRSGRLAFAAMTHDQASAEFARSALYRMDLPAIADRAAWLGDVVHVPRLIEMMRLAPLAKAAGRSFSLMTGVNIVSKSLTRHAPVDDVSVEPPNHALLPTPDAERVARWWHENGRNFLPGRRLFLGRPLRDTHCLETLQHGVLAYRRYAAEYLCLLRPGTRLFNVDAPAWRQRAKLAGVG